MDFVHMLRAAPSAAGLVTQRKHEGFQTPVTAPSKPTDPRSRVRELEWRKPLVLRLTSQAISSETLHFSAPRFSHLQNGGVNISFPRE